ncbi:hypothetical protein [Paenibacillus sp. 2TAB19]|uniref:hypothetical protein n=1 Tax=Paenibacillus sp. 2TAB19 TaxID=3233003 RepID=UPI003F9547C5
MLAMLGMTVSMLFTPVIANSMTLKAINIYSGPVGLVLIAPLTGGEAFAGHLEASSQVSPWVLLLFLGVITGVVRDMVDSRRCGCRTGNGSDVHEHSAIYLRRV